MRRETIKWDMESGWERTAVELTTKGGGETSGLVGTSVHGTFEDILVLYHESYFGVTIALADW